MTTINESSDCPQASDYSLHCCCNSVQLQVLIATAVYAVLFFLLWRTRLLFPLKLFPVAMFEINRALGVWLSCGRVLTLNLFEAGSGTSEFRGGKWFLIYLFGYFGSLAWGFACIVASADFVGVQVMAGMICALLLVLIAFAKSWRVVVTIVFMLALMGGFWACTVLTEFNGLRFLVLAIGTITLFFPLYNVCLVQRRPNRDSVDGANEMVEMSAASKTTGFIWGLMSLAVAAAGVYLGLVVGSNPDTK